jgi:hypothetical protein
MNVKPSMIEADLNTWSVILFLSGKGEFQSWGFKGEQGKGKGIKNFISYSFRSWFFPFT